MVRLTRRARTFSRTHLRLQASRALKRRGVGLVTCSHRAVTRRRAYVHCPYIILGVPGCHSDAPQAGNDHTFAILVKGKRSLSTSRLKQSQRFRSDVSSCSAKLLPALKHQLLNQAAQTTPAFFAPRRIVIPLQTLRALRATALNTGQLTVPFTAPASSNARVNVN